MKTTFIVSAALATHLALGVVTPAFSAAPSPVLAGAVKPQVIAGVVKNDTNVPVSYQVQVSNEASKLPGGNWKPQYLLPGGARAYSFPYPAGSGQIVRIRFDNTLGDRRLTFTNSTIVMQVCAAPRFGWQQRFIIVNGGRSLTLAR